MPILTDLDHSQIAGLRNQGYSYREIVEHLRETGTEVSETTVRRSVKEHPGLLDQKRGEDLDGAPIRLPAGRVSQATSYASRVSRMGAQAALPHRMGESYHRMFDLAEDWGKLVNPANAILILARQSPEVSNALTTAILLATGGWECRAYQVEDSDQPDEEAQPFLDDVMRRVGNRHGTMEALTAQLVSMIALRGALATEAVYGKDRRTLENIVVIDPAWVKFRKVYDPILGDTWEPGQQVDGDWISLAIPTVRYVAHHPLPDEPPYGVPLFSAAIMPAVFLLGLLYDVRRVMARQGFGRINVVIEVEKILARMPNATKDEKEKEVKAFAQSIQAMIDGLSPDDIPVMTDDASWNEGHGSASDSLAGVDLLIDSLRMELVNALKTTPIMLGITEGGSDAVANKDWEIYAKQIRSLQHYLENMLGYHLRFAMRQLGIDCLVKLRFAEVREVDAYRAAETLNLQLQAAALAEDALYMTPDEAANFVLGHDIPEVYRPRLETKPGSDLERPEGMTLAPDSLTDPNGDDGGAENPDRGVLEYLERLLAGGVRAYVESTLGVKRAEEPMQPVSTGLDAVPPGSPQDTDLAATERFWDEHVPTAEGLFSSPVEE